MYLENSIDEHEFVALEGAIFYRQEQLEIIERPGVVGSGARRLGARGRPFDLVSVAFHEDFEAAASALQEYDDLAGENPVTLTRNGVNHGTYLVLEVFEIATEAVVNPTGNADSTDEIRQTVRWKLLG